MQRPPPAAPHMSHVTRFPNQTLHQPQPPPPHIHPLHQSVPISYPQPGAQSQPPRYVYSAAVPLADSSRSHAQPTTTSRSVQVSHGAINVPSYAPASHAQYAPKIAPHMHSHIPYTQPQLIAPPPRPPSDPHGPLHPHVVMQSRPIAPPSPLPAKPGVEPNSRLPPPVVAASVNARPLQPTPPTGARTFVGPLSKDQFVDYSARDLDYTASKNDNTFPLPLYSEPESVFFSVVKPEIPTREYMKRLVTYTHCSPSAFILMLVYLDRVAQNNKKLVVTPYNMHRLLITALTLACKNLDDQCFANAHYAKVGGIPTVREMNRLELQFLKYLKYVLFVNRDEHERKIRQLCADEPNSPTSIHGQPFPPPGPTKMGAGVDRRHNSAIRPYGGVPMKMKAESEADGNRYPSFHHNPKNCHSSTVAPELNCAPEMYEKATRNGMSSAYGGVQSRMGCSTMKRCSNLGMEAMEVCRGSAPIEVSYVTSTSRGGLRP
ncbi:Cyclin [Gracilaria domingensis]|nr:Cyclin [Gracilaria domingensis]